MKNSIRRICISTMTACIAFLSVILLTSCGNNAPDFSQVPAQSAPPTQPVPPVKSDPNVVKSGRYYACFSPAPDGFGLIKSFSTSWTVPPNPTRDSTLYWWNGLLDSTATLFMQPVLGWSGLGGPFGVWTISNWYLWDGIHLKNNGLIVVHPGDTLTGVIELTSWSQNSYTYKTYFKGYPSIDATVTYSAPVTMFLMNFEGYTSTYLAYPQVDYVEMKNVYATDLNGKKFWVTDWDILISSASWRSQSKATTPSKKYTEIVTDPLGGVDFRFYCR